jgi:hypothetical protein
MPLINFLKNIALVVTLLTPLETSKSKREEIQGIGWNVKKELCLVGLGTNTPTPQNQIRKTRGNNTNSSMRLLGSVLFTWDPRH